MANSSNQVDTSPLVRPEFRKRRSTLRRAQDTALGYALRHSPWEFSPLSSKSGEIRSREWKAVEVHRWELTAGRETSASLFVNHPAFLDR